MPAEIEGKARELLEAPNFAYVGTKGDGGSVQVNPIWVHVSKDNPYEYVSIRGRVVEDTHEGAKEQIDFLAKKYLDKDEYPWLQPGEQRIVFRIQPERVHVQGG